MARTLTFDAVFKAGFAIGVGVSMACETDSSTLRGSTAAANTINVSQQSSDAHPLAAVSGLFADDPLWSEYLRAIEEIRAADEALESSAG